MHPSLILDPAKGQTLEKNGNLKNENSFLQGHPVSYAYIINKKNVLMCDNFFFWIWSFNSEISDGRADGGCHWFNEHLVLVADYYEYISSVFHFRNDNWFIYW